MNRFLPFLFWLAALLFGGEAAIAQQVLGGFNLNSAPPVQSIGSESQYYIDWNTGNVFGPKTSGQWGAPTANIAQGVTIINPLSPNYGAKCNGTADDTAAFQSMQSLSNVFIQIPVGTCNISSPLVFTGSNVTIWGYGNASIIQATADINPISFNPANSSTGGITYNNAIGNLFLTASSTVQASITSTGFTVVNQTNFKCSNFYIQGFLVDFDNQSSTNVECINFTFSSGQNWPQGTTYAPGGVTSTLLKIEVCGTCSSPRNPFMIVSNFNIQGNGPGQSVSNVGRGVAITAADGLKASNGHIGLMHDNDLYIQRSTHSIIDTDFTDVFFDNSNVNLLIDTPLGGATGSFKDLKFSSGWFASSGYGSPASTQLTSDEVSVKDPAADIIFAGVHFRGAGGFCVDVTDANSILFQADKFESCGNATTSTQGAVNINPSASSSLDLMFQADGYTGNTSGNVVTINGTNVHSLNWGCEMFWLNNMSLSSTSLSNMGSVLVNNAICNTTNGQTIANLPDSTSVGGNARGNFTVDLQTSRSSAAMVAAGKFSQITGGENNGTVGWLSRAGGNGACDSGEYAADVWASGYITTACDSVVWHEHLFNTITGNGAGNATQFLTSDGLGRRTGGNGGNCVVFPPFSHYNVEVKVTGRDITSSTAYYDALWPSVTLDEQSNAASATVTINQISGNPYPIVNSSNPAYAAVALSADTTRGCLAVQVTLTAPGNTDVWHFDAEVTGPRAM